jgi:hypothetical protein
MTGIVECAAVGSQTQTMTEVSPDLIYSADFTFCSVAFPVTLNFDPAQPGKIRIDLQQTEPGPSGCNLGFSSGWQTPTTPMPNLTYTTTPTFCRFCPCCSGFGIQSGWEIYVEQT